MLHTEVAVPTARDPRWAKVIDHGSCIGCHACSTACKAENEVPLSVNRTYVKYVDVGLFPQARRAFQVTRCNQCQQAPCVAACPTAAMYARPDGIVDFDKRACIGCKACIAACPYDAIFINPDDHSAEKCNFCAHRIEVGLEPACVTVCPTQAILVGDLGDPATPVSTLVLRGPVNVRRPEKGTQPKLFYRGAHQATLDPLAARRPDGGIFVWSEQTAGPHHVVSGHPEHHNSSAVALLSYDVPHTTPWDWRVSLYTWTKGIAVGAYLVPLLMVAAGITPAAGALWQWMAPIVAGAFLALTGLVLIADLEHPTRFYYLFTRPQARSWLVRGSWIIVGYSAVLALHVLGSLTGAGALQQFLMWPGMALSALAAVYTAYLFAQARARDLWQSPLLAPHMLVQAIIAGSATVLLATTGVADPAAARTALAWLGASSLAHLIIVVAETTLAHPTSHAHLAVHEMTRGAFARPFWVGVALLAIAAAAPWLGALTALPALAGLLAHEHAYVQAGQAVPLA